MVYFPSEKDWEEILSTPQMARLTQSKNDDRLELSLIIRCRTIELKYLLRSSGFWIMPFHSISDVVCYGIIVDDHSSSPLVLWTACRDREEHALLLSLASERRIFVHAFNEACVNVASCEFTLAAGEHFKTHAGGEKFEELGAPVVQNDVQSSLDAAWQDKSRFIELRRSTDWSSMQSHVLHAVGRPLTLNLAQDEEGTHQEQLAGWLAGSLHPDIIELNLRVGQPKSGKEFADLTLSYPNGSILIESKALALLKRDSLPARDELRTDVEKKIRKAVKQLRGGCRSLHSGLKLFNSEGVLVEVERDMPAHAICLVPDQSLTGDPKTYAADFCSNFTTTNDCFHLLDTAQLFRMVQAAEMMSKQSSLTPMACFDAYLMQRAEIVAKCDTTRFDMMIELSGDVPRIRVNFEI